MPKFYKVRGMELPTVIFFDTGSIEFVKTKTGLFEYSTNDSKHITLLTEMGYMVEEPSSNEVLERTVAALPTSGVEAKPIVNEEMVLPKPIVPKIPAKRK